MPLPDIDPQAETPTLPTEAPVQAPAAPAADTNAAAPAQVGVQQMQQFQDVMRDPNMLKQIAVTYLKNGDQHGLEWLAHAHNAANENMYTALGYLRAGMPDQAMAEFNKSGRFQIDSLEPGEDGKWVATQGGQQIAVDPQHLQDMLLSPEAFSTLQQRKPLIQSEVAKNQSMAHYYDDRLESQAAIQASHDQARTQVGEAQSESRKYAADAANARGALSTLQRQQAAAAKGEPKDATAEYSRYVADFAKSLPDPAQAPAAAQKAVLNDPSAVVLRPEDDGTITAVNRKTGEPYMRFPDQKSLEAFTGSKYGVLNAKPKPGVAGAASRGITAPPAAGGAVAPKQLADMSDLQLRQRLGFAGADETAAIRAEQTRRQKATPEPQGFGLGSVGP